MAKKRIKVTDVNYNQEHLVEVEESDFPSGKPTAEDLLEVIEGSETVVVDLSEDEEHVEVHLDADVVAKVDNSLQTPVAPPLDTVLVGIDHSKSQVNIGLSNDFKIENGKLLKQLNPLTITNEEIGQISEDRAREIINHIANGGFVICGDNLLTGIPVITGLNIEQLSIDAVFIGCDYSTGDLFGAGLLRIDNSLNLSYGEF